MSLHLGNISPHIHRDELERVFQRFGRCTVRLKDKFGFVVYDYPANAEKALKTLRGKTICGKPITLSWSNRQPQPKPAQRFAKVARSFEPPPGKNIRRRDYLSQDLGYNSQRGHKRDFKPADNNGGRPVYTEPVDEFTSHHGYDEDEDHTFVNDFPGDSGGGEATVLQNGRWEEQGLEPLGQIIEPQFDRYVPSSTEEKTEIGNKFPSRLQIDAKEEERSRNSHRSSQRDSSLDRTTPQSERKDYRENKRRRANLESTKYYSEKAQAPVINLTSSDHTASGSQLRSRSLNSLSISPSNSLPKSSPSRKCSLYSSLRSGSPSNSRSSSPASQPFSVSVDKFLTSSSNKLWIEQCPDLVDVWKGEPGAKYDASSDKSFKVKDSHAPESYISDPNTLGETGELENNNDVTVQDSKAQSQHPDALISDRSHVANLMKLSSEELRMVLEHYKLEQPEEMEEGLPVEDCFGCARFWPWEIIYYRRYKKGQISTENYTHRL